MSYTIVTIEDDLLIAEDLKLKLKELGYSVLGNSTTCEEAIQLLQKVTPDLLIVDIMIEGEKDGIETVTEIQKQLLCPVIFLTANSESATVKRALATHPAAFLIKPFKISEFSINIDLAIRNFKQRYPTAPASTVSDAIFIPDKFLYHRVCKSEILFVEADGSYVRVVTTDKKYQITTNLKGFEAQFKHPAFYRVSRKHLVNLSKVNQINGNVLYLKNGKEEYRISISQPQRAEILSRFEIIRTKG
ncbi:MAG: response regulator [Cyclobacteriaceae bacterium]|nr:response regulator [Cyclobacteriaceae bacterium]